MLENRKKRTGASLATPNKMIIKVSLLQEGDIGEIIGETTTNASKHAITSNVVNKTIKVVIEGEQSLKYDDTKQILEVEVLEGEVVEDQIVEEKFPTLEDDVVVTINLMG
jgi:two-component sensor histidine kinase